MAANVREVGKVEDRCRGNLMFFDDTWPTGARWLFAMQDRHDGTEVGSTMNPDALDERRLGGQCRRDDQRVEPGVE